MKKKMKVLVDKREDIRREMKKEMATHSSGPGKTHGQRSLAGNSPGGHKRIDYGLATKQQQRQQMREKERRSSWVEVQERKEKVQNWDHTEFEGAGPHQIETKITSSSVYLVSGMGPGGNLTPEPRTSWPATTYVKEIKQIPRARVSSSAVCSFFLKWQPVFLCKFYVTWVWFFSPDYAEVKCTPTVQVQPLIPGIKPQNQSHPKYSAWPWWMTLNFCLFVINNAGINNVLLSCHWFPYDQGLEWIRNYQDLLIYFHIFLHGLFFISTPPGMTHHLDDHCPPETIWGLSKLRVRKKYNWQIHLQADPSLLLGPRTSPPDAMSSSLSSWITKEMVLLNFFSCVVVCLLIPILDSPLSNHNFNFHLHFIQDFMELPFVREQGRRRPLIRVRFFEQGHARFKFFSLRKSVCLVSRVFITGKGKASPKPWLS